MDNLPAKLIKYKDLAKFLIFHARPALKENNQQSDATITSDHEIEDAEAFANSLKEMGPTFAKFGQLLSTRNDLLPAHYIDALQHLQDDLEPASIEEIEEIFTEDLGISPTHAFVEFDPEPIAAASLGQTYKAVMRDGQHVAVKVQRPNVTQQVSEDLDMLKSVTEYVEQHSDTAGKYAIVDLVNHFKANIKEELNYTREAHNLSKLAKIVDGYSSLVVPLPLKSFCSRRVLTMEFVTGTKITELSGYNLSQIDGETIVEDLIACYLQQFIVEGFFHADPHPGNLMLTRNHQLAFLDLGMVGRLSDDMRSAVYHLLSGICENKNERVVDVIMSVGLQDNHLIERKRLASDVADLVSRSQDISMNELQFGSVVMQIIQMCASHGVILPKEFNLVAKALLNLDQIAVTLAPDFNPSESVKRHLRTIAIKRGFDSLKPSDAFAAMIQMKDLLQKSPHRLNLILDNLAENKFRVNADVIDETALLQGFQKIANRITIGVIVAALIVGSALMMRVETGNQLFGYPSFSMILMIVALVLGSITVFSIFRNDR